MCGFQIPIYYSQNEIFRAYSLNDNLFLNTKFSLFDMAKLVRFPIGSDVSICVDIYRYVSIDQSIPSIFIFLKKLLPGNYSKEYINEYRRKIECHITQNNKDY